MSKRPYARDEDCRSPVAGDARLVDAHHWLILLGRYVCQARKPQCWRCVVAPWCDYQPKTPAP